MKKFLKMICVMMALSVLMSLMTACNSKSKHDGDKLYEACMLMSSLRSKELSQAETKLEESFGIKLLQIKGPSNIRDRYIRMVSKEMARL